MTKGKEQNHKIEEDNACRYELQKERESAKRTLKGEFGLNQILGRSKVVREIHEKIGRISSCDVNVLITGESGTGKELVARAIHHLRRGAEKPFVSINCGAIPENLFENELYGHVKGAFTDAHFQQIGLVKAAEGGTLFLDEIGAISPYVQVKFLRFLQDQEYKPLGDPKPHFAKNVGILAATNKDLLSLVKEGAFREDLYYRINVVSIYIPPIRERREDIPILAEHFLKKFTKEYNLPDKELSLDAIRVLASYSWPGNIRELENKVQQLVVMSSSSMINAENLLLPSSEILPEKYQLKFFKEAKIKVVDAFEKSYLIQLRTEQKGDMVSAARRSGKSRTALWNLLKKHDLSPKPFRY